MVLFPYLYFFGLIIPDFNEKCWLCIKRGWWICKSFNFAAAQKHLRQSGWLWDRGPSGISGKQSFIPARGRRARLLRLRWQSQPLIDEILSETLAEME